jgi:hypothetical protein
VGADFAAPPLIARQQQEALLMATPVHVTAAARRGIEVSVINRELVIVMQHSGG